MMQALPADQRNLMIGSGVLALLSLIKAPYIGAAPLQMGPPLIILAALAMILRKYPMPTGAVACLCAFLVLHTLGARYVYSNVPYDVWFAAIGLPRPTEIFGWQRNHYDRLVHLCFGLLFTYPIAEFLRRHWQISYRRALYIAAEFIIAVSALYEVFEWLLTLTMASADADAYNGQQGDAWDAQKDMALASLGTMLVAAGLYYRSRAKPPKN